MKKVLVLILALTLALSALCFAGCTKDDGNYDGVLRFGFDCEYPPYGYLDTATNQYTGFDIDFAKLVCEEINYKLELIPIDWNAKDTSLSSGAIDCIWSGFTINGRESQYEWTVPYVDNSIVVLVSDSDGITKLADLAGKTVAVQDGSSGKAALDDEENTELTALVKSFEGGSYRTIADYTSAFQELKTGAIQAIVIDLGVAEYLIDGKTGFSILKEQVSSEQYGVGFLKGNTELCKKISDAMEKVAKTDAFKQVVKEYGLESAVIIGK